MVDHVAISKRSEIMRAVRSRDTGPERVVRSVLHCLGFRFRLHRRDLPGRPDIVLVKRRIAIFVNGCFWHRHPGCAKATAPKTNVTFWQSKFQQNVDRDTKNYSALRSLGYRVVVVWQCEIKSRSATARVLTHRVRVDRAGI